jgi:uncharacterized membrane protein
MSRTSRPRPAAKSERRAPGAGAAARSAKRRGPILASLEEVCARSGGRIVFGLALATATILSVCAALKYRFYLYDDFDLAIFHQATLQLLRGSLFTSIRGMAWPGDHSSLVLVLIAPLAALIRHPLLLPVLQAIALSFSALVVHRIARAELGSAAAAVLLSAAWLLQPALAYLALFEFHPEALAVPALLLAWSFTRERRTGRALACAGFALLCKEDVALVVLALALFPALDRARRSPVLAGGLAALAIASLALTFAVLKPRFGAGLVDYGNLYQLWGPDLASALRAMVTHPWSAFRYLFGTAGNGTEWTDPLDTTLKREYWLHLLLPWAALPVLAPLALVPALPIFAENLLAWRHENHVIVFHYAALVLPFLAIAAIHGIARVTRERGASAPGPMLARGLAIIAVIAALGGQWMFGPFGKGIAQAQRATQRILPGPADRTLAVYRDSLLQRVAGKDHLIIGFPFLPRVSDRADVHTAHHVLDGVYTFSKTAYPLPRGVQAAVLDMGAIGMLNAVDLGTCAHWDSVIAANHLRLTHAAGDLLLFERGARDTLRVFGPADSSAPSISPVRFGRRIELHGAGLGAQRVRAGDTLPITTTWLPLNAFPTILQIEIVLSDRAGSVVLRRSHLLGYGLWAVNGPVTERYNMIVDDDVPPGTYLVAMALTYRAGSGAGFLIPEPPQPGNLIRLGTVEIVPRP